MKHLLIIISGLFLAQLLHAQATINGKVLDEKQKPAKAASVLLLRQPDSVLVQSALTNEQGEYFIGDLSYGKYMVMISVVGYDRHYLQTDVKQNSIELPVVSLVPITHTLSEVTVVATKPFLEQKADRLVVNIESSATSEGSNALEVLKKIPGVIIRNDKISIGGRNSVMIMIDGRPSQYTDINLVLKDISANNISKIELITNPGAKYDAAGGSIINVILKKNASLGTNGSITIYGGNGLYDQQNEGLDRNFYRYSSSVSLNHREGKVNVFGTYSYTHRNWFEYNEFDRMIAPNRYFQKNLFYYNVSSHVYSGGLDYYADKKNTFGFLFRGFNRAGGSDMKNNTDQFNTNSGQLLNSFTTLNSIQLKRNNYSANVNWKHEFDSLGQDLNIDLDYSEFNINNNSNITNNATSFNKTSYTQIVDNPVQLAVIKIDYSKPFTEGVKWEIGVKSSYAKIDNFLTYSQAGILDTNRSTQFLYKENINAAYTNLTKKWNSWQLVAGIRTEQTIATGNSSEKEVLNRNYWQVFPSLFITKNINSHFAAVTQYSKRVDRPSYQQQNPFVLVLDSLTYTKGNPLLKSQLTDAYKFSITYDNQPLFSVSYNRTNDVIFENAPKQEGTKTFTTPENLARFENIAFELNFPLNLGKRISGFGGNQAIFNHYTADYLGGKYDDKRWNWLAYWQVSYKPAANWNIELSGYYTTKLLNEFFTIGQQGSLGIAIQKTVWEKKGKFTLNFNDVLFSEKTKGSVLYQDINVKFRQWEESRNLRLSFTYSFGNQSLKATRARSTAAEEEKKRVKPK